MFLKLLGRLWENKEMGKELRSMWIAGNQPLSNSLQWGRRVISGSAVIYHDRTLQQACILMTRIPSPHCDFQHPDTFAFIYI